jgi:perosamine synthetase
MERQRGNEAMSDLAIHGGTPELTEPLRPYPSVGAAEAEAVRRVVESGCLSGFYGSWGDRFLGGPLVRVFEAAWSRRFGAAHTVSVNSATSGLFAAIGAIGAGPGDDVIVPPYTMSATAMAPLVYGATPVFADIDADTFCLDPASVSERITERTRAIIAVNLFGHPARLAELRALADAHGITLIEDNAQSPFATEHSRLAGTIGHIGVFSLNYHKHIHTGEGGMCVTDDEDLALRLQLIRNHGENLVEPLGLADIRNLVGFNYRMTELSAAVGLEQLARADEHMRRRVSLAERLSEAARDLPGITPPAVRDGCTHVYYVWSARIDQDALGVGRERFSEALTAEGFPNGTGYVRPLYMLPLFQRAAADSGFAAAALARGDYRAGICPVAERMHESELLMFETCAYDIDDATADRLAAALRKVYEQRAELGRDLVDAWRV